MKRFRLTYILVVLLLLVAGTNDVFAQLPSSGNWPSTTINANTTISLTGDVNLKGNITVASGKTLTILNETGKEITIRNQATRTISMFTATGTLIIKGKEGSGIIIDGGADYTWDAVTMSLTPGADSKKVNTVIVNNGTLDLEYVTIQNADSSNDNAAAIDVSTRKTTTLTRCTIRNCRARLGAAIMISSGANKPDDSAVRVTDSFITQCVSGGDSSAGTNNVGGAIRTYGSVTSNLYLTGVTLSYNYAMRESNEYNNTLVHDGNGGALFWNGRGHEDTACYIESCVFENNRSDDNGGAIKAQGSILFVKGQSGSGRPEKTVIRGNQAPVGAGLYIEGYTGGVNLSGSRGINYDLSNLVITDNVAPSYMYGGVENPGKGAGVHFYFGKEMTLEQNSTINVNMKGAEISGNKTAGNGGLGGGIYVENNAPAAKNYTINVNLNYGKVNDNVSTGNGGGIYILNENVTSQQTGGEVLEIKGNTSLYSGGGMHIEGGGFDMTGGMICSNAVTADDGVGAGVYIDGGSLELNEGSISENTSASHGGGAYVAGGGNFTMSGGEMNRNNASGNGGGVFLDGGDFEVSDGIISANTSKAGGGGAYIAGGGNFTMSGGSISGNYTESNGGGAFLDSGELKVTDGSINDNEADLNGGGICILNGAVDMGSGLIISNECGQYGGGVYVYNSSDSVGKTMTFNGGSITENVAEYGGGVCVDGLITLSIGSVEIAENTAVNGGGVCLLNKADIEFGKGQIKNNNAKVKAGTPAFQTAWQKEIDEVAGLGGGLYLSSGTVLAFTDIDELGLFGNFADSGGDEIFANGKDTKVTLPVVTDMNLTGYPGASNLSWMEDYVTDDINYDKGTKKKGTDWDSDKSNKRYRVANDANEATFEVNGGVTLTNYVSLALGYEIIFITIVKYGLEKGESAIFELSKGGVLQSRVIMTGEEGKDAITKRVAVTAGEWTIVENVWSWAYTADGTSMTKDVTSADNRVFEYRNQRKDDSALPMNHEDVKLNVMGTATSE